MNPNDIEREFMDEPTFGMQVRAIRMGYGWAAGHGCYVRISGSGPFLVEVHRIALIPNRMRHGPELHRRWWPDQSIPNGIEALKHLKKCKREFSFTIDEEGKTIRANP